ncbi:hypothetical protein PLICRDRAFT_179649 [Plicaturopsis crispa FD-325 SS-3]|uniref:DUF7918 domain-containing protein n=1 Tax=Plicaturopsis crispa FD-325 SS-3 TaxID=944288 RepID=A0A0C9SXI2_PLICR|nr:hypothetical protein PLICRDRAFT_179649 [Plicaturopsis crispa FD-325 SS-3]
MLQTKGFSAWVEVENVKLQTHGEELHDGGRKATGWIASEAGKAFSIYWRDSRRTVTTKGSVTIDGIDCGHKTIHAADPRRHRHSTRDTAERSYISVSDTEMRPYVFANLTTTDDDAYLDAASAATKIGQLEIQIWQATVTRHISQGGGVWSDIPQDPMVHERAKKAMPHCVKFGDAVARPPGRKPGALSSRTKRIGNAPLVTFVFNYRPIELLRANGIAPPAVGQKRKASAAALDDQDPEDDEDAKIRALEEQLQSLKQKRSTGALRKPKTEPSGQISLNPGEVVDLTVNERAGSSKRVKRERESGVPVGFAPGEVIDLT